MRIQILILGFKGLNPPFFIILWFFFSRYCNYLFRETQTSKVDKTKQNKQTESKTSGSDAKCQLFSKAKTVLHAVLNSVSPNVHDVRESNTVLDSGFHVVDSGFQLLDSRSFSGFLPFQLLVALGISTAVFRIPQAKRLKIPDSTRENLPHSGVRYMGRSFSNAYRPTIKPRLFWMRTSIYMYTIAVWLLAQKAKSRGGILGDRVHIEMRYWIQLKLYSQYTLSLGDRLSPQTSKTS